MKETLEEAAEKRYPEDGGFIIMDVDIAEFQQIAFTVGAKWQTEKSYSEIELFINEVKDKLDLFEYTVNQNSYISEYLDEWFEQFKK